MLLLLVTLAAAPSAAGLSESRAMHGALVQHVQYHAEGETTAEVPLSQMTREQLRAEYQRLEDNRPGIGAQITMIALGGATIFAGVVSLYVSLILALARGATLVPIVIGVGLLIGGGALLTIGIIMLRMAINERRPFNEEMDEIQQRLDGSWQNDRPGDRPPPPPRDYEPVVPPPPPPPPAADGYTNVRPSVLLATF